VATHQIGLEKLDIAKLGMQPMKTWRFGKSFHVNVQLCLMKIFFCHEIEGVRILHSSSAGKVGVVKRHKVFHAHMPVEAEAGIAAPCHDTESLALLGTYYAVSAQGIRVALQVVLHCPCTCTTGLPHYGGCACFGTQFLALAGINCNVLVGSIAPVVSAKHTSVLV
jgi:hypothetical protein